MSARIFLTDSLLEHSFGGALLSESLSEFLSASLFDVWLGGDAGEVKPDLILMAGSDDPGAMSHFKAPIISLSDSWVSGADDAVHPEDFDLLAISARALIRRKNLLRMTDHYADKARRQNLLKKTESECNFDAPARLLVFADEEDFAMLVAQLDGRHKICRHIKSELIEDTPGNFDLIIVKDDLDIFVRIAAQPDHNIPVMFWSGDRSKIIKALDADASGYIADLSQAAPRIMHQVSRHRQHISFMRHLGSALDMAIKDELTGLYNRRCLTAHLPQVMKNMMDKDKKRLAVILFDLDRFKHINDYWGHDAGDEILQHVARLMKKTLRADDSLYRIGGEEFLALLPDISGMEEAYAIAHRLCAAIRDAHFLSGNDVIPVTISAGVGLFQPGERAQNLLKRADQALLRAKRLGRNQAA